MSEFLLLCRLRARRDLVSVIIWATLFVVLWGATAKGISNSFDTESLHGLALLLASNPAARFVRGGPTGAELDAVMYASVYGFLALAIGFAAALPAIRHTRAEEERGPTELVLAGAVRRHVPLLATIAVIVVELVVILIAFVGGSIAIAGFDLGRTLLAAAALGGWGLVAMFAGLLAGQIAPTARSASFGASGVILLAFILRGVGEAQGTVQADPVYVEPGPITWASPIGWGVLARPFASSPWEPNPAPLLLFIPLILLLAVTVLAIERRREIGDSLIRPRLGRPTGAEWVAGPGALSVRTRTITIIGYLIGAIFFGSAAGFLGPLVEQFASDSPAMAQVLDAIAKSSGGQPELLLVTALGGFCAVLAAAATIQLVSGIRADEREFGEAFGSAAVSRWRWYASDALLGLVVGAAVLALFALGASTTFSISGISIWGDTFLVVAGLAATLPLFAGLAGLLVGWAPRALAVVWVLLFAALLVGDLAPLFAPDVDWLPKLSPFHWVSNVLAPDFDATGLILMPVIGAALLALGALGFRRRDLDAA